MLTRFRSLSMIALLVLSSTAGAATLHWTGSSDLHWNNAANWQEQSVPSTGDTLVFTNVFPGSMINDLPAGTVLAAVNGSGSRNFTLIGNMVELSGATSGFVYQTNIRARGNVSVTSTEVDGAFDVNGFNVTFIDSRVTGPLTGTGTLHWNNFNSIGGNGTFSGPMTAGDPNGELTIDGSLPSASLSATTLLTGDGTIGPLALGFQLLGGLHTGDFSTLPPGAHSPAYFVTLSNGTYRITHVHGSVTFDTLLLVVNFNAGFTIAPGHEYVIFENDGSDAINGIFSTLPEGAPVQYGAYNFRITYKGGDGNDAALIAAPAPAVTITSPGADTTFYGQPVTIDATASGALGTPSGTITFRAKSAVQSSTSTVPLVNGHASITMRDIATATATISAHYNGDGTYSETDSNTLSHTVNNANTRTSLRSSNNPALPGEPVTFTATVQLVPASTLVPHLGYVHFFVDGESASTQTLIEGEAAYTTSALALGGHAITATYEPNPPLAPWFNSFNGSQSAPLTQQVREPGPPVITPHPATVFEGNSGTSSANVTVTLTSASQSPVSVSYATADGTATAPGDYTAASGTLTFAPGETSKTISIAIAGDTVPEAEERLFVLFSNPLNAMLGASSVRVSIINDDAFYTAAQGVEFASPGGRSLVADIYVPAGNGPFPAIVAIDANDWWEPRMTNDLALREASRGYVVAMLSFRSPAAAPFPAQIHDIKAGVRWLRANAARFSVDPARIGALGIGGGAHLAELLGTTTDGVLDDPAEGNAALSSRVRAVAALYGASDLPLLASDPTSCADLSSITQLLGCAPQSCPENALAASPITWATGGDDASFLLLHGTDDCVVPASQSQRLYDALHAAHADATLMLIPNATHDSTDWATSAGVTIALDAFFDRMLTTPSRHRGVSR
ncbi:MAG TPA: Ig-like domain repeat protein [Thermoanaerobaculia bacterium]|nr:Ig-like domain repeat protein [Thermoanaerobaculia bacterium]